VRNPALAHRGPLSGVSFRGNTAIRWRISALLPHLFRKVGREPENFRLGGCAGSPKPTCLSLQFGKCRVILPNCRDSAVLSQKKAVNLNGLGKSLPNSEQGDHHSKAGRVLEAPRAGGALPRHHTAQLNVVAGLQANFLATDRFTLLEMREPMQKNHREENE
jgi:hypothetical protein